MMCCKLTTLRFVSTADDRTKRESLSFWFNVLDVDGDGVVSVEDAKWFYDAVDKSSASFLVTFEDLWYQILDMVKPAQPKRCVCVCARTYVFAAGVERRTFSARVWGVRVWGVRVWGAELDKIGVWGAELDNKFRFWGAELDKKCVFIYGSNRKMRDGQAHAA
jgi:hypothetical protein